MTLDADGALRAFVNVCRHRGAIVASAPARRGTLQCPYHARTYGLDGALRAAPRSDREPCFERDALGLGPVAVDTWGPFVFVCADADAEPLDAALGDLPAVVAEYGLDVGGLRFHRRYPYELNANWKIAVENYLECYHSALNHPGFVDAVDDRALRLERAGARLSQFAPVHPRALASRSPYDVRGPLAMSQFHLLVPAMKLNVCPGPPNLSIGPVWPVAPTAAPATSTTSSPPTSTRGGSPSSPCGTSRSAPRTSRSSRRCRPERAAARSRWDGCWGRPSR